MRPDACTGHGHRGGPRGLRSAPGSSRGAGTACASSRCGRRSGPRRTGRTDAPELVCSNSFRSDNPLNAVGLLKREMEALDSLIIRCARAAAVPAGDALAMDRAIFSGLVTEAIAARPEIEIVRDEAREIPPEGFVVIATGPLTSPALDARDRKAPRDRGPLLLRLDRAGRGVLLARLFEDVRDVALRKGRRRGLLELPARRKTSTKSSSPTSWRGRPCRSTTSRRGSISRGACRSR